MMKNCHSERIWVSPLLLKIVNDHYLEFRELRFIDFPSGPQISGPTKELERLLELYQKVIKQRNDELEEEKWWDGPQRCLFKKTN